MNLDLNNFLLESNDEPGNVLGFFYGIHHQIKRLPFDDRINDNQRKILHEYLPNIHLKQFNSYSESDELCEFRLLNHRNRLLIQSAIQNDQIIHLNNRNNQSMKTMIIFGYDRVSDRYLMFNNHNCVLVLCGRLKILSTSFNTDDDSDNLETKQLHHHEGLGTINLRDCISLIEIENGDDNNNQIKIHIIFSKNNDNNSGQTLDSNDDHHFFINSKIPYRFLQRTICKRKRNMLKIKSADDDDYEQIETFISLETFDHLLLYD